jgi:putative spermidine/putrescine transport system substrate-binding protein
MFSFRKLSLVLAIAVSALLLVAFVAACGSSDGTDGETPSVASTATSVADFGDMDALIAAAKEEGTLNVIALPPDWANYKEMLSTFESKYGIKINSAQPDGSSQDEINAATQLAGTDRAPDVFDVGGSVALANLAVFAPYKSAMWDNIPDNLKDPDGLWTSNYTGYMSIGYNADKVPAPTTMNDLLKPAYKGTVALNGNPTQASAGFNGVVMATIASDGTADDLAPGVDFFSKLNDAGNLLPVDPTPATIASGQTPIVIDWDYNNVAQTAALKGKVDWQVVVPANEVVAAYYNEAINKDAPHPAAARLWNEFVYSAEGQNIWLRGAARPVLIDMMTTDGTIDTAALEALPVAEGTPVVLTEAQITAGQDYLLANWNQAVQ